MTSSFLETLLDLPCIINNNYETPFKLDPKQKRTVNISGEERFWEKFRLEKSVVWLLLSLNVPTVWRVKDARPAWGDCPSYKSLGEFNTSLTLTHTRAMKQSDSTLSTCMVTQGRQRQTKDEHSSSITVRSGDSPPCVDSWSKNGLELHQKEHSNKRTLKSHAWC